MRLDLKRFPAGSAVERLLIELCATRDEAPQPAEAQIAVWLARNRISWASFQREGGTIGRLSTFRGNQAISGRHARGAAALLLRSGTDPRGLGFFKDGADRAPADVPAAELAPQAADAPEPAQEPQAAPEEAQPTAPADPELSAAA